MNFLIFVLLIECCLILLFNKTIYKEEYNMGNSQELTIQDVAELVNYYTTREKRRKNLIDAYTYVRNKTKTDYSYEEIKDYLFHHNVSGNS